MRPLHLLFGLCALAHATPSPAQSVAIVHAKAWTGASDAAVEDATIIVRGGKIASIMSGGPAPDGIEIIDAAGRVVTPGLFAGATQIGLVEVSGADDTADQAVDAGKLGAAFDIASALNANSLLVEHARSDGFLWALSFPSGSSVAPFLGQAAILRLTDGDILDRSKVAIFVRIGGSAASNAGGSRAAEWTLLRRALDEAKQLKAGRLAPADDRLFSRIDLEALQPVVGGVIPLAIQTERESTFERQSGLSGTTRSSSSSSARLRRGPSLPNWLQRAFRSSSIQRPICRSVMTPSGPGSTMPQCLPGPAWSWASLRPRT